MLIFYQSMQQTGGACMANSITRCAGSRTDFHSPGLAGRAPSAEPADGAGDGSV